ncbi:unnamed protein product, partial [Prorocentrum cordatum]
MAAECNMSRYATSLLCYSALTYMLLCSALHQCTNIFVELADEARLARNLPVYRKVRAIGQGAFGKAYLVEAARSRRQRVLKKLPLADVGPERRESAFSEALLMRRISRSCPLIVQYAEVVLCKGGAVLGLIMEFCAGGDLRRILRAREGHRLPEPTVLAWAAQIGLALRHCHAHGVLHRDVKPDNCFFRSESCEDLILGDFGISCTLGEQSFAKTVVGSPMYLSPEIVNQEPYSFTTDVWSLGVMTHEMAMLEAPFKGVNICQVAFRIVGSTPPRVDTEAGYLLQQLLERVMEKDPRSRAGLPDLLVSQPLEPYARVAAARHGLPPPDAGELVGAPGRAGLVGRLRGNVAASGAAAAGAGGAADDGYEEPYLDDFEEPSGSEGSYEADFEVVSESSDDPEPPAAAAAVGALRELSEEQ